MSAATAAPESAPDAPARYGVSALRGIGLVAKREILSEVRQKSFLWSVAIMVVLVVLMIVGSSLLGSVGRAVFGDDEPKSVSVTAAAAQELPVSIADAAESAQLRVEASSASSAAAGLEQLRSGETDILVLTREEASGLELFDGSGQPATIAAEPEAGQSELVLVGAEGTPTELAEALSVRPATAAAVGGGASDGLRYGLSILFAVVFMFGALGYCQRIAQTVVEEKASRIVEILLATVTPKVIMAGKVIGNSILALGQMAVLGIASTLAMMATGQGGMLLMILPAMLAFAAFFVMGFVMLAALYAGAAALVSRQEEVASVTMPLMMLIMLPYMAIIFLNGNPAAMVAMSYIPFSAPIAMPVRMVLGEAQWWEPVVSLGILAACTAAAIWIGARLYENSVLRTGGRVKVGEALRGA